MTRPGKEIVNAAIPLAEGDRRQIDEDPLASSEPDTDNVDAAWAVEVERRSPRDQGTHRPTYSLGRNKIAG